MDHKRLNKVVKVSDPWCWYNKDTVEVILEVIPRITDKTKTIVQIAVVSCDDFAVYRNVEVETKYSTVIESFYNHFKEYLFDRMPKEISLEWLYEHGYIPD